MIVKRPPGLIFFLFWQYLFILSFASVALVDYPLFFLDLFAHSQEKKKANNPFRGSVLSLQEKSLFMFPLLLLSRLLCGVITFVFFYVIWKDARNNWARWTYLSAVAECWSWVAAALGWGHRLRLSGIDVVVAVPAIWAERSKLV